MQTALDFNSATVRIVVNISACHTEGPGSIPGGGSLNLDITQPVNEANVDGDCDFVGDKLEPPSHGMPSACMWE